jgi:acetylornithine deacetylase/succinyl-diaminopimelate desuccinylase-like protein
LHPDLLDPQRFLETFRRFSEIGWDGERGMYRLSLSESDLSARRLLIEILRSIGASISYDEAGNIIAEIGGGGEGYCNRLTPRLYTRGWKI